MMSARRLWLMCVMSLALYGFLITRLGYLQLYCHADLAERAEREGSHKAVHEIARGAITDRTGDILAMSIQGGSCFADPKVVTAVDDVAQQLSPLLNMPASVIKNKLREKRRFVWLARRLDPETAERIKLLKRPGIIVTPDLKRFYPEENLAAQVLGVVSDDQKGLSGVEHVADGWLTGRQVPFLFKQWSLARPQVDPAIAHADLPRRSLVLTLDRSLQTIAEQELAVQMKLSRPRSGTVIIQDPQTGEILAMATAPSFSPNDWGVRGHAADFGPDLLKNPAIEKVVEPGSTFKLVTAAAALEEHKVKPDDSFFCENGTWQIPGRTIHDHERDGWLTFTEVISHSSNIGTAKVGIRVGDTTLYRYARAFGFGMPSGCGLPGDGVGILHPPREWRASSLATISFGQEIGVTPLQMVNAYSVVANGGWLMEPRLYKGIVDDNGVYREWAARKPIRRVVSLPTVDMLKAILQNVVERGTGKAAQVAGVTVAGKTGTAQKIDPLTHQYSADRYLASFCGFAPVDHPRLVIGVFLDEPRAGSYYGGSEAAPLFSRIVRDASTYLHLTPAPVGPLVAVRMVEHS